jgi:hypothetical protein
MKEIKPQQKDRHRELEKRYWDTDKRREIGEYGLKKGRVSIVTAGKLYLDYISWVNLRQQAAFDMPCASCGTSEEVQQHHLKHIRKRAYSLIPQEESYQRIMALRNRKQIPLCAKCHIKLVHAGKYQGTGLVKLAPVTDKLVDNRIIHVESFVKPGQKYHSKPLVERVETTPYNQ